MFVSWSDFDLGFRERQVHSEHDENDLQFLFSTIHISLL